MELTSQQARRNKASLLSASMEQAGNSLLLVAVLLVAAKGSAAVSTRFGMPGVLGMLTAGVIAGPAVLHVVRPDAFVNGLSEMGVILLMFIAGMETDVSALRSVGRSAFFVAAGGVVLPMAAGYGAGRLAGMSEPHALFLGAILTATSVSITAETLKELGRLNSREGTIILGAAVIDDVLGVLVLSGLIVAVHGGSIVLPLIKLALFSVGAFALGKWALPLALEHDTLLESDDTRVAVVIGFALLLAWAAAKLGGLADVTGAYLAGIMLTQSQLGRSVGAPISRISYSLFIPIFFVVIGSAVTAHDLVAMPLLSAAVVIIAIITKFVGCGATAVACRETISTAARVGAGMVSRGEVALVVASVGLADGFVSHDVFSLAIVVTVVTTLAAPLLLKLVYSLSPARSPVRREEVGEAAFVADSPAAIE